MFDLAEFFMPDALPDATLKAFVSPRQKKKGMTMNGYDQLIMNKGMFGKLVVFENVHLFTSITLT